MIITVSKDGYIDLERFKTMVDISQVVYYDFKYKGDHLTLKFYNKDKELIKPYANQKETKKTKSKKV
jgi:hypothetical protein